MYTAYFCQMQDNSKVTIEISQDDVNSDQFAKILTKTLIDFNGLPKKALGKNKILIDKANFKDNKLTISATVPLPTTKETRDTKFTITDGEKLINCDGKANAEIKVFKGNSGSFKKQWNKTLKSIGYIKDNNGNTYEYMNKLNDIDNANIIVPDFFKYVYTYINKNSDADTNAKINYLVNLAKWIRKCAGKEEIRKDILTNYMRFNMVYTENTKEWIIGSYNKRIKIFNGIASNFDYANHYINIFPTLIIRRIVLRVCNHNNIAMTEGIKQRLTDYVIGLVNPPAYTNIPNDTLNILDSINYEIKDYIEFLKTNQKQITDALAQSENNARLIASNYLINKEEVNQTYTSDCDEIKLLILTEAITDFIRPDEEVLESYSKHQVIKSMSDELIAHLPNDEISIESYIQSIAAAGLENNRNIQVNVSVLINTYHKLQTIKIIEDIIKDTQDIGTTVSDVIYKIVSKCIDNLTKNVYNRTIYDDNNARIVKLIDVLSSISESEFRLEDEVSNYIFNYDLDDSQISIEANKVPLLRMAFEFIAQMFNNEERVDEHFKVLTRMFEYNVSEFDEIMGYVWNIDIYSPIVNAVGLTAIRKNVCDAMANQPGQKYNKDTITVEFIDSYFKHCLV